MQIEKAGVECGFGQFDCFLVVGVRVVIVGRRRCGGGAGWGAADGDAVCGDA